MPELEDFIKQSENLFDKKKYKEIIDLLSDEVLTSFQNANLYTWRARAHNGLQETDSIFTYANKALEIDPSCVLAYRARGNAFYINNDYDHAFEDFNIAINLNPTLAVAYVNRGLVLVAKGSYDQALQDFEAAIKLNPDSIDGYLNRATIWEHKEQWDLALKDYSKTIELKPDHAISYYNRAAILNTLGKYDSAIEDYTQAIFLNPNDLAYYNNRGVSWFNKEEYLNAIADFTTAIKLNKASAQLYKNRGIVYDKTQQKRKALADYEKSFELNPSDTSLKYWRDELRAELGKAVDIEGIEADEVFYKIVHSVKGLNIKERENLLSFYKKEIDPLIIEIRKYASNIDKNFIDVSKREVAHYSNLKTADIIINSEKSKLRYSNAVFMNDPDEGKILIDYLDNSENSDGIKAAFKNIEKEEQTNFYLGSFLPAKGHDDELLMWRTYGKDENQAEAAGCCFVIDVDFFDKGDGGPISTRRDEAVSSLSHPLYRVLYYNQRDLTLQDDDNGELKNHLNKLKKALSSLLRKRKGKNKRSKAIERILYHSLSELRFFFKSADYSYENELRVIQFATSIKTVTIDKSVTLPRKMYIESTKEIQPYLKKIVLGPKVPFQDRWIYLAEEMKRKGYKIQIAKSTCRFQ